MKGFLGLYKVVTLVLFFFLLTRVDISSASNVGSTSEYEAACTNDCSVCLNGICQNYTKNTGGSSYDDGVDLEIGWLIVIGVVGFLILVGIPVCICCCCGFCCFQACCGRSGKQKQELNLQQQTHIHQQQMQYPQQQPYYPQQQQMQYPQQTMYPQQQQMVPYTSQYPYHHQPQYQERQMFPYPPQYTQQQQQIPQQKRVY